MKQAMLNLSREYFWNDTQDAFPTAVQTFYKWVDDYKQEVNWEKMFGDKLKFHDLPLEMQVGILARFQHEVLRAEPLTDGGSMYNKERRLEFAMRQLRDMFRRVERHMRQKSLTQLVIE